MSDRSLDEFATVSPPTDDADESSDADDPRATPDTDTPTPTLTMRWSSPPVACDACGAAVSRRWRAASGSSADDDFVCADCKEW